jgi:hypothetical protein
MMTGGVHLSHRLILQFVWLPVPKHKSYGLRIYGTTHRFPALTAYFDHRFLEEVELVPGFY